MNQPQEKYARSAARLLVEERPPTELASGDARRDTVVAAMALAIAGKRRRRRILRGAVVTMALAASIAVVAGLTSKDKAPQKSAGSAVALFVEHEIGKGNLLVRAGVKQALPDLAVLAEGDSVRSDQVGGATLVTGNGTSISLAGSSHLRIDELGTTRRFALLSGMMETHVAKLAPGERFIVSIPDGEVEVRGTVFTVSVSDSPSTCRGSASVSTVKVGKGAVSVRSGDSHVVLHPGETWSTPCPAGSAPQAVVPGSSPGVGTHSPAAGSVRRPAVIIKEPSPAQLGKAPSAPTESVAVQPSPSRLAEQNDLFQAAMSAERQGQSDMALRQLDALTRRFPGGPLEESARAERNRILSAQGKAP